MRSAKLSYGHTTSDTHSTIADVNIGRMDTSNLTAQQQRHVGGGTALAISVFVVWLCGNMGLNLSAEMGTLIGGLMVAAAAAIWTQGIRGVFIHIWRGDDHHAPKVTVETDVPTKVVVEDHDGPPPQD